MTWALPPALAVSSRAGELHPTARQSWSAWQRGVLADASPFRVIRAANQIGKTTVMGRDLLGEIRGDNPYRPRRFRGPVNVTLLSQSQEQLAQPGGILQKLFAMFEPGEIDPRIRLEVGQGVRGVKHPVIPFVAGLGDGSCISIRTYDQDPMTLSGSTIHHVYCDEPMPQGTYDEMMPRLLKHGGTMTIGFTPVPNMPPQDWLWDLVDRGLAREHHAIMSEANAWPEGYARPFLTQAAIEEFASRLTAASRGMRVYADREPVYTDRHLTAFHDGLVREFGWGDVDPAAELIVGTDHGVPGRKQWSVLVAVAGGDTLSPRYWIIDEAGTSEDVTTTLMDARRVAEMLRRNGLSYRNIDAWIGDRDTADRSRMVRKSNDDLRRALAEELDLRVDEMKPIEQPLKYRSSVEYGEGLINSAMHDGRLLIHPRCVQFAEASRRYRGGRLDRHKDILDAGRYGIERGTRARQVLTARVAHGYVRR